MRFINNHIFQDAFLPKTTARKTNHSYEAVMLRLLLSTQSDLTVSSFFSIYVPVLMCHASETHAGRMGEVCGTSPLEMYTHGCCFWAVSFGENGSPRGLREGICKNVRGKNYCGQYLLVH